MLSRRAWLGVAAGHAAVALGARSLLALADDPAVTVYKSPTCGCCSKWVDHMRAAGLRVTTQDVEDVTPIKDRHGVPEAHRSCHTALVAGFVVEGHVPADVVREMLKTKPAIIGIAVGGMPAGSPGMEMGARRDPYEVVAFAKGGKTSVFAKR